jgi:biofilm PGA synthesis N-glycosyltransferase PgaC
VSALAPARGSLIGSPGPLAGGSVANGLHRYVLITPARNEAQFIGLTLQSVIGQTWLPCRWVIVSDGSTDGTDDIVREYVVKHPWIELVRLPERAERNFAGKVGAFNAGYARVRELDYEIIGNLDADVSFDADYLEFLVGKFAADPRLGVAGTPYKEDHPEHDEQFKNATHVSGACQLFRRECFEEIGGYPPVSSGGVDLIALLSAQAKGWRTRRFDERVCHHHRAVGGGTDAGPYRRLLARGAKDYRLGSHPLFELFRCVNQMRARPRVVGGMLMLTGYLWAMVRRTERTMPAHLIVWRQRDQLDRLMDVLRHPWSWRNQRPAPPDG